MSSPSPATPRSTLARRRGPRPHIDHRRHQHDALHRLRGEAALRSRAQPRTHTGADALQVGRRTSPRCTAERDREFHIARNAEINHSIAAVAGARALQRHAVGRPLLHRPQQFRQRRALGLRLRQRAARDRRHRRARAADGARPYAGARPEAGAPQRKRTLPRRRHAAFAAAVRHAASRSTSR